MSWRVQQYLAKTLEEADGAMETWRGVDSRTAAEVVLRKLIGDADSFDEAVERSSAMQGLGEPGLAVPIALLRDDDDLVVVYDAPARGSLRRSIDRRRALTEGNVGALVAGAARQLGALHRAGMTHGSVNASTVGWDRNGASVLIGVVESAVRRGSAQDTAADDVRSLAAVGLRALHSLSTIDNVHSASGEPAIPSGGLAEILRVASGTKTTTDDPCDPSLAAGVATQCAPYLDDEPPATESTDSLSIDGARGTISAEDGAYVPRHRRTPEPGRWARASRVSARSGRGRPKRRPQRVSVPNSVSGPAVGLSLVAVLVGVAAWIGTVWGDGVPAQGSVAAASTQSSRAESTAGNDLGSSETTAGQEFVATSATPAQWSQYLTGLYLNRAKALTDRDATLLESVYTPSSPQRESDLSVIGTLIRADAQIVGFSPQIIDVQAAVSAGTSMVVQVVDRLPDYAVIDGAGVSMTHAGRDNQVVTLTLRDVEGVWRIETAVRTV